MPAVANPLVLFPVIPSASSYVIRIENAVPTTQDITVTLSAANEWLWTSGDGGLVAGDRDLSKVVLDALNTNTLGLTWSRTIDTSTHRFTFTVTPNGRFRWDATQTTFDPAWLGYTAAAGVLGATHAAPNVADGIWPPARPFESDTRGEPVVIGALARSLSGVTRGYVVSTWTERMLRWTRLPAAKVLTEYVATTEPRSSLQRIVEQAVEKRLRIYDDEANHGTSSYSRYVLKRLARPWSLRDDPGRYYDVTLELAGYVA